MREVTTKEINEIAYALLEKSQEGDDGLNYDEQHQYVDEIADGKVGVFDNYSTSSPGYHGPVFVVIWAAGPSYVTTLSRDDSGKMRVEIHPSE